MSLLRAAKAYDEGYKMARLRGEGLPHDQLLRLIADWIGLAARWPGGERAWGFVDGYADTIRQRRGLVALG